MSTEEQLQNDLSLFQRMFSSFRFLNNVCNQEWGNLVEGVSAWKSAVTRIASSAKIIESESGYKVTVPLFPETTIKDKNGDIISSLKIGDYISIDGLYRMRGKFSNDCDWEVQFEKVSEINVIGKCTTEGKENIPGTICCPWLVSVGEERYCTRCGDGICKSPESKENCPLDCAQIGDEILITIKQLQKDDFVLEDDFIRAKENPTNLSIMVLVGDETKFYSRSGTKILNEYSFLEFYDLIKKWSGPSWFFKVKGVLQGENKIKGEEVYYYVQ